MENNKLRGKRIDSSFATAFKNSSIYNDLYLKHQDELILGVRNGYINLYYNCDSIAKISFSNDQLRYEIAPHYLDSSKHDPAIAVYAEDIIANYETIKKNSNAKSTEEKETQQQLFFANNSNPRSKWYCFDVEYKKRYKNTADRNNNFQGRFDILAISKTEPFRVAIIELKYGSKAIGGKSGIRKHIKDFYCFNNNDKYGHSYYEQFKDEIISILKAEEMLGVHVPDALKSITKEQLALEPEYYIITLNNNPDEKSSTPKMTMSGYLFADKRWGCRKVSEEVYKEGDYFQLIHNDEKFKPVFLFSDQTKDSLHIDEIVNPKQYSSIESNIKTYKDLEGIRAAKLFTDSTTRWIFDNAENKGLTSWINKKSKVLYTRASSKVLQNKDRTKNLYSDIRGEIIQYMEQHQIAWWHMEAESDKEVTAHIMSSQVACFNHLFKIRNDETTIKAILKKATGIEFEHILPSLDDDKSLISFEFTYKNDILLGEDDLGAGRGKICTSIDAFIRAEYNGEIWLLPIEWKYTEEYETEDKTNSKRLSRYQNLIETSQFLISPESGIPQSVYFQEPYYELMRQTVLCEQIMRQGLASHLIHLCIVPKHNSELTFGITHNYIPMLKNPEMFKLVSPEVFMKPIKRKYSDLFSYLQTRYWN